jgi:hypothetical protein
MTVIPKGNALAMTDRLSIRDPGEFYRDMLLIEAWLKGERSLADEACNLLCARLMARAEIRGDMIAHLARKRGIDPAALIVEILAGRASPMSQEDFKSATADETPKALPGALPKALPEASS